MFASKLNRKGKTLSDPYRFRVKDPMSALTHFIAFVCAIVLTPVLIVHISKIGGGRAGISSLSIFMASMILLYGASSAYHTFDISNRVNKILKKIDHMMIFVFIAGSYTPICIMALGSKGLNLLIAVWSICIAGIVLKAFWVTCPKWFSSLLYISMGWLCINALPEIVASLSKSGFAWLLAGGIIYTLGGIIYALKFKKLNAYSKHFGSHEIFHIFVMAGSFCHFILMYRYLPILK